MEQSANIFHQGWTVAAYSPFPECLSWGGGAPLTPPVLREWAEHAGALLSFPDQEPAEYKFLLQGLHRLSSVFCLLSLLDPCLMKTGGGRRPFR